MGEAQAIETVRIKYLEGHVTGKKLAHVDRKTRRLVIIERAEHGQKLVNTWTKAELDAMFDG